MENLEYIFDFDTSMSRDIETKFSGAMIEIFFAFSSNNDIKI